MTRGVLAGQNARFWRMHVGDRSLSVCDLSVVRLQCFPFRCQYLGEENCVGNKCEQRHKLCT